MAPEFEPTPEGYDEFDVNEELERALTAENNKPWDRRMGVYHPSSLGKCKRNLYYDRTGVQPIRCNTIDQQVIFQMGHATHWWVQNLFKGFSKDFEDEVVARNDELGIGGSCDGVFTAKGWILEIKSIGDSSFSSLVRPIPEHVEQVHAYMVALRIPRAQLLYVNRNNGSRQRFRIFFSDKIWSKVLADIEEVEQAIENEQPPERKVDFFCRSCKFSYVCQPFEGKNAGDSRAADVSAQRASASSRGRLNNPRTGGSDRREEHKEPPPDVSRADNKVDGNGVKRPLRFVPRILRVPNNSADKV